MILHLKAASDSASFGRISETLPPGKYRVKGQSRRGQQATFPTGYLASSFRIRHSTVSSELLLAGWLRSRHATGPLNDKRPAEPYPPGCSFLRFSRGNGSSGGFNSRDVICLRLAA